MDPGQVQGIAGPDLIPDLLADRPPVTGWRWFAWFLAIPILFVLGIIGWISPFVPGIPLILLALAGAGLLSPRLRRRINATDRRLPARARLWLRPRLRHEIQRRRRLLEAARTVFSAR